MLSLLDSFLEYNSNINENTYLHNCTLNVEREKQSNWIPRNNLFCSSLVEIKYKWELDSLIHIEKGNASCSDSVFWKI